MVGVGEGEHFIASAIPAFLSETRRIQLVENDEIVAVRPDGAEFMRADGSAVEREVEEVDWDEEAAEKGGYETFMLKEIHEQPDAVADTVLDRLSHGTVELGGHRDLTDDELRNLRRIVIVGLRHLLPRGPRRPLRDRVVVARAGRDGHRLGVPLPQPGDRRGRPGDRDLAVRRDRRHAGGDAAGARARRQGAGDHERHGQPGHARLRRGAVHARRPRDRRGRHQDLRRAGRGDVPVRAEARPGARHARARGVRPARRRSCTRCRARSTELLEPTSTSPPARSAGTGRTPASSSTSAATSACRWRSRVL